MAFPNLAADAVKAVPLFKVRAEGRVGGDVDDAKTVTLPPLGHVPTPEDVAQSFTGSAAMWFCVNGTWLSARPQEWTIDFRRAHTRWSLAKGWEVLPACSCRCQTIRRQCSWPLNKALTIKTAFFEICLLNTVDTNFLCTACERGRKPCGCLSIFLSYRRGGGEGLLV